MSRSAKFLCTLLMTFIATAPSSSRAAAPAHWVGTWAASPVSAPNLPPKNDKPLFAASDLTLRQIVHVSLGGSMVRIVFTNEFGSDPLTIGAAHIALRVSDSKIQTNTSVAVTFSGQPGVIIPAGALVVSDPVALQLPALSDLAVSLFIPAQKMAFITQHSSAAQTNYIVDGNRIDAKSLDNATEFANWRFLKGVDVMAPADSASIVTLGDSITDGAHSTKNMNTRWPDFLARRLQADKKTAGLGVLNEGIGGNRVLHDVTGPSALARFDRDVIAQAGVKYLIILESINDIGHAADPEKPYDVISADDLIAGYTQLARRAHTHGIKVIGATVTPYVGAKYASPTGEAMRQAVNKWIRTSTELDGFIDFDKATADPANPTVFSPTADSGDHLHPGDAGYKIMGDAIDLSLFTK